MTKATYTFSMSTTGPDGLTDESKVWEIHEFFFRLFGSSAATSSVIDDGVISVTIKSDVRTESELENIATDSVLNEMAGA